MTRNSEIAQTILQQLGGGKFVVMTGAKDFVAIENGLQFKLGRNKSKCNTIRIILTGMDDYIMEFWKISLPRWSWKKVDYTEYKEKMLKRYEGLYFDQLQEFFTETTGLYTRLF